MAWVAEVVAPVKMTPVEAVADTAPPDQTAPMVEAAGPADKHARFLAAEEEP